METQYEGLYRSFQEYHREFEVQKVKRGNLESKSKMDRRDRISLMDDEDRDENLRNPEDEEILENQGNENDTREPGTETRDPPRVSELRRTRWTTGARVNIPFILKGYATSLEPQKMSTEI